MLCCNLVALALFDVHSRTIIFAPGIPMDRVSVSILRYVGDSFPGFVECLLVDADGREHHFIEKVPVIGGRPDLSLDSVFPQPGHIGCTV